MLVAQAAQDLGSQSGLLMFLLGGGLIGVIISAYKFVVNFRTTERSLARQRVQEARGNERAAQHEAGLWQARCADLEYLIRREIGAERVPKLSADLQKLVEQHAESGGPPGTQWESAPAPEGRPGT